MADVQSDSIPVVSPDHVEHQGGAARGSHAGFDAWLNIGVAVLLLGVLGAGAYFGYTVYVDKQLENATSPAGRIAAALSMQIRKNPNDAVLRVRLGEAFSAMSKFPQAIEQFNAAIKINPKHAGAYLDLGLVATLTQRPTDAQAYFQKVVALTDGQMQGVDQTREAALYNLGLIALRQKEYNQAAGFFKAALGIRNDSSDTYYQLAQSLRGLGDTDGAIQQLGMAVTFDPSFAVAHYALGQLFQSKSDPANASFEFRNAANRAPGDSPPQQALAAMGSAASWIAKANASLTAGDVGAALTSALVAGNIDPKNESIPALLTRIEVSNPTGAVSAYTLIALRDPTNTFVQSRIVVVKKLLPPVPKPASRPQKTTRK